jgi:hypothetical protein
MIRVTRPLAASDDHDAARLIDEIGPGFSSMVNKIDTRARPRHAYLGNCGACFSRQFRGIGWE